MIYDDAGARLMMMEHAARWQDDMRERLESYGILFTLRRDGAAPVGAAMLRSARDADYRPCARRAARLIFAGVRASAQAERKMLM